MYSPCCRFHFSGPDSRRTRSMRREPVAGREDHARNRTSDDPSSVSTSKTCSGQHRSLRLVRSERVPRPELLVVDADDDLAAASDLAGDEAVEHHGQVFCGLGRQESETPAPPAGLGVSLGQHAVEVLPDDDGPGRLAEQVLRPLDGRRASRRAVMSHLSVRAIRFRSSVMTWKLARFGAVRVTTVNRRHCEKDPVFKPSPNRPSSFCR